MSEPFLIDAHTHIGHVGVFCTPDFSAEDLLRHMDQCDIRLAICTDSISLGEGVWAGIAHLRQVHEWSQQRIFYLGVYDPRCPQECLRALRASVSWPGFRGLKLHPSIHQTPAEDASYRPAWEFAAEHGLPILTHSWSVSDYNPVQALSTPERFEHYVRDFPSVRLVLGHAGGRGKGRLEAIRMARHYPNVFMDFSGDIYCYRLLEELAAAVPVERILFGSDFPWLDPRSHLTRVLLAPIGERAKRMILVENAIAVYRLA